MERKLQKDSWVMWVLKSLLVSYVITGILLLLLAVALFKFELNEKAVSAAIVAISTGTAGVADDANDPR